MNGKKFLVTAIACAAILFGFNGTSSAAEISNDFATLQVENQELAWGRPPGGFRQPPPPPPPRYGGPRDMRRGDNRRGGDMYNTGGRNNPGPMNRGGRGGNRMPPRL